MSDKGKIVAELRSITSSDAVKGWMVEEDIEAITRAADALAKVAAVLEQYDEFWEDAPEDGWRFHRDVTTAIGACAHECTRMNGWKQVCDDCGQGRDIA